MKMNLLKQSLAVLLACLLVQFAAQASSYSSMNQSEAQSPPAGAKQSPEELQQLVAPIALYPDALVSQIVAAATYPTEIVEADRWMQEHPDLKGKDLADEVNKQSWDPSVKALAQFPSVLANMDKNLSWTSALGEAYVNQPQDVMDAVQVMRARAEQSGNLKSNKQVKVQTQGQTIVVEPADPEVVYVPAYDPWIVYGAPVVAWPGWYWYPGLYVPGPGIAFGVGFGVGFFAGFGWGWGHWGMDWGHRTVIYNHNTFVSRSRTFYGRHSGFHDFGAARGYERTHYGGFHNNGVHGGIATRGPSARGFAAPHNQAGMHSGAFGGFDHGGVAHSYSFRGQSSFGGGGFHGGGFHGGGRH
ncbi:MAG TPA: DUF3300 domain-containing protein [Candidatus Acidoferrum sp.]|jgi:hypothetical protein